MTKLARILILLCIILNGLSTYATDYFGRITSGSYISKETFTEASDGTTSNDFSTISTRFYFHASEITKQKLEFITDLRDKHDFFDKLDRERLELNERNTFQLRQASIRNMNDTGSVYNELGRFPISEAGAVNVDGLELGNRFSHTFRSSLFAGLNPKRPEQSYLQYNKDSYVGGAYSLLQLNPNSWKQSFYLSNAVVAQKTGSHLDRTYFFNNLIYSWDSPSQIVAMVYLDFIPRVYIQNGFLSYRQKVSESFQTTVSVSQIDVIEYSHRRGVLEQLNPSPYREASLNLKQNFTRLTSMHYNAVYGIRNSDALKKQEYSLGPEFDQFLSRKTLLQALFGYRNNFTSTDEFVKARFGYYSNDWEFSIDEEYDLRNETVYNKTYNQIISEFSVARYLSKALYATLSYQDARNERVTIYSGFFKIGYRFGTQDVAPLRDGAPATGGSL